MATSNKMKHRESNHNHHYYHYHLYHHHSDDIFETSRKSEKYQALREKGTRFISCQSKMRHLLLFTSNKPSRLAHCDSKNDIIIIPQASPQPKGSQILNRSRKSVNSNERRVRFIDEKVEFHEGGQFGQKGMRARARRRIEKVPMLVDDNLLPNVPRRPILSCHLIILSSLLLVLLALLPSFSLAFTPSTSDQLIESLQQPTRQHQHQNLNSNQQQQYQLPETEEYRRRSDQQNQQQATNSLEDPQVDQVQYQEEDELLPLEPYVPVEPVLADAATSMTTAPRRGVANHLLAMASLLNSSSMVIGGGQQKDANSRALLPLDSSRLLLPQMQQIKSRFNQGCVGGTKCQFFAFCWMSGGSLGASCGLLMTCCVTPSRQEIQPGFYGPVVNDPYCGRSTSKISRIVGGTDASFGQFPWQAFVQVGGSRCGGALISSRHVVTAGHCVARSQHSPSSIKVTLGDYILNSDIESIPHEIFSVVEVLLHPNFRFTPQADRYDVAVLELDRQASYKDNIKPICLPQKDATFVGRVAYVAGWGALQAGSKLRPKVLQHVAVPVIENHVCEGWHRRKGIDIRIYDEMMCAGYELGQRDACQGDSGGPLMLNQFGVWYLVGIVSAGYSCAKQYQPGIYHRVSSSSDWISSNIYQQQQAASSAAGGNR